MYLLSGCVARRRVCMLVLLGGFVIGVRPSQAALLTFEDITLGVDGTTNVFGAYDDPASTFTLSGDFQARGLGASSSITPETAEGSGTVSTSLAPFGSGTITLADSSATPFALISIDLAREFEFNVPSAGISYPEVTFTGTKVGGGVVSQTFVVDQAGFFFETFSFSADFTDLVLVSWVQPAFGTADPDSPGSLLGLHQFDNVLTSAASAPEPSTLGLLGLAWAVAVTRVRRSRTSPSHRDPPRSTLADQHFTLNSAGS